MIISMLKKGTSDHRHFEIEVCENFLLIASE